MTTCHSVKNTFQMFNLGDPSREKIFFTRTFTQVFILSLIFITCTPVAGSVMPLPYKQHLDLNFNPVNFELEKSKGPLVVEFSTQPQIITDKKVVFSDANDKTGHTITVTRPDEFAQLIITVKNKDTGQILLEKGYGGIYDSSTTTQKYTIMNEGPYIFDIQGQKIGADLSIWPQNYVAPASTIFSGSAYPQPSPGVTRVAIAMVTPTNAAARTTYTVARTTPISSQSASASVNSTFSPELFLIAAILGSCILLAGGYVVYKKAQITSQGSKYIPPIGIPPVNIPLPDDIQQETPLPEPTFPPLEPQRKSLAIPAMNDLPRQKLKEILSRFGTGIITNPKQVKGLLLDYCASQRSVSNDNLQKEIHVLILAINQNIPQELLAKSLNEPFAFKRSRLQKRLTDLATDEEAAKWAVESWAEALGVT
jgi:hypothetical protein